MKAFVVNGFEHSMVLFDERHVSARRRGADELGEDFGSVSCRRAPEFDAYAGDGSVPDRAKLAAGWWLECRGCYQRVVAATCAGYTTEGHALCGNCVKAEQATGRGV